MDHMITVVVAVLTSSAVFTFIQFLIKRHDEKKGVISSLQKEIMDVKEYLLEMDATLARIRILQCADEIRRGERHSKESFDQALADIKKYNAYCKNHPNYENDKTVISSKFIKDVYQKLLSDNDFE